MMRSKPFLLPIGVAFAMTSVVAWAALGPFATGQPLGTWSRWTAWKHHAASNDLPAAVRQVDQIFEARWARAGIERAAAADDLEVLRRLSLALLGTVPSLEEIREFERDSSPDRLERWTTGRIADWRFVEFFGERLATALVNNADNEFRDKDRQRFVEWLGRAIQRGRPYDAMVRGMIAGTGYSANDPAVLFVGSELSQEELAPQRLAARTARAFLGQRIGCAQCHDHPFAAWKQSQFEGLAAHFSQVRVASLGIQDEPSASFVIDDQRAQQKRTVAAAVPFDDTMVPPNGTLRQQLAVWVTHHNNRRFRRATANRVWGLIFGRPYVRPVDDVPDPSARLSTDDDGPGDPSHRSSTGESDDTELLDVLGDDWAAHGYDLRRLVHVIAASRPFRLASDHPSLESPNEAERIEETWAAFPITQLTAQQLMRSLQQAASVKTVRIREEASTYTYIWNRELTRAAAEQYGDAGDMNQEQQTVSITQAMMRLVGPSFRDATRGSLASAAGRISAMTAGNPACLEACYLVCLSRRPSDEERAHFLAQLDKSPRSGRRQIVEDIFWTLLNSPEFSWNH